MNNLIKKIFTDFKVDDVLIPVKFIQYDGNSTTYITYQNISIDNVLSADDDILGYIDYYDFDIYSKGDYFKIIKELKKVLKSNGFTWQPSMSSEDMYEDDTGYFHKTLCFSIDRIESEE